MAGNRIVHGEEEAAGEVAIGATEVVGDAAKVVVIKERAGDLGVRVHGGAEIIQEAVFEVDLISLIMESMQGAGRK